MFATGTVVLADSIARPNILVIVTDDQRFDTVGPDSSGLYMPSTQREIFDKGVAFRRGYVTTPKCCPSRSSIFTGKYASKHHVTENGIALAEKTFALALKEHGYRTGLVGKFLNSSNGDPRPDQFDYWVSFFGGSSRYMGLRLNVNGEWQRESRYTTTAFTEYAKEFIAESEQPFFLLYSSIAPHRPASPEPKYRGLFNKIERHRPKSFNSKPSRASKPRWIRTRTKIEQVRARSMENFRRRQLATLRSLDDGVAEMIELLQQRGQLENTMIVFLSDNGIHWGEHGLFGKDSVYEESIRVPFAVRYDGLVHTPGLIRDELVANIDLAPTILELAGVEIPVEMDGRSLVPLLESAASVPNWRDHLFIEVWRSGGQLRRSHFAVHTGSSVYALHVDGEEEFYNLNTDPLQLKNRLTRGAQYSTAELSSLRTLLTDHMAGFLTSGELEAYSKTR
jgi:arylsulfatase A-like enzyme